MLQVDIHNISQHIGYSPVSMLTEVQRSEFVQLCRESHFTKCDGNYKVICCANL